MLQTYCELLYIKFLSCSALPIYCLIIALPYSEPVDGVVLLHCRRKDIDGQELECDIHGVTIRKPHKYDFKVACPHQNLNDKVRFLKFQRSSVEFLPKSLFNTFRNVQKAEVNYVELEYLHPEAFHYARHLTYLDLSHNQLQQVGDELSHAGNLVYLDISHNQIKQIHPDTFKFLKNLKILLLEANFLTTFNALDSNFHELDLQLNYLSAVCANATILNLSSNRIKSFSTCKSRVHELQLSNNLFSSFNVIQLTNIHGLRALDLSRNGLKEIHFNQLPYSLHLQKLNLSQCQLMRATFNNLHYLQTLDLSYNPQFNPIVLRPLKNLEELHIKGMKFAIEDFRVLQNELKHLKTIHILSDWTCEYLDEIIQVFCKTNVTVHFGKSCTEDVIIDIGDNNVPVPRYRAGLHSQTWFIVMLAFGTILSITLAYIIFKNYCLTRLQYY